MSIDSTGGYHSTYRHRTRTAYEEPIAYRQGYTEPYLTVFQHGLVIAGSAAACACATAPIAKLEKFYFLSDVPGESSRIYMSDKRAHFFRVLFHTRWWQGRSLLRTAGDYAVGLALFVGLRRAMAAEVAPRASSSSNGKIGFIAGAAAGAIYAVLRHPFDVLRTTAEASTGPKAFRGAADVFFTAVRQQPRVLRGLYRGFSVALMGRTGQFALQFGLYNYVRYDGVYRGPVFLFLYCHLATVLGLVALYPVQSLRQQLYQANTLIAGRRLGYRAIVNELRRRHGLTKVYDGFFRAKPFLNAVPPALLMCMYDVCSRRYTEYLHPNLKAAPTHQQSLWSVKAPEYVVEESTYEFARKKTCFRDSQG